MTEEKNISTTAFKSGIWYTVCNFVVRALGFLTIPIFTRLLTQAEFGAYNTFASVLSVFTILTTLRLESTFISAKRDYKDNLDQYAFSIAFLESAIALICFILIVFLGDFLSELLSIEKIYLYAMQIYLVFLPGINLFQVWERFRYQYKWTVFITLLVACSSSFLALVLVIALPNKLDGRVFGQLLPGIIIGFILLLYLFKRGKTIDFGMWKYAIPIGLPYVPHLLSMTFLGVADRVIISWYCGEVDTALYSLAYSCGLIVTILATSLNSAFSPWLSDMLTSKNYKKIRKASRPYLGLFGLLAVAIILLAPEVLLVLGGEQYAAAVYCIPPVAMGCVCQFAYTMFVNIEQYEKKTAGMAVASLIAAIINCVLNIIFIPVFGYLAAAYVTLISYLLLLLMHAFLVKRIGFLHVYDCRFIAICLAVIGLITIGINAIYDMHFIRLTLIALLLVLLVGAFLKNKAILKNFLR